MRKQFLILSVVLTLVISIFLTACSGTQVEKIVDQPETSSSVSTISEPIKSFAAEKNETVKIDTAINQTEQVPNIDPTTEKYSPLSVDITNTSGNKLGSIN